MVYTGTNTTGWSELYNGHLINAAYTMYNTAFIGFFVFLIFLVFEGMLWYKTKNVTLTWVIGLFFASMYGVSSFVQETSIQWIFILLVIQLAGILFMWMFK